MSAPLRRKQTAADDRKPGLRERKKAERRQAIRDCAREFFRKRGFDATSMEDIATACDVSVGTVYNYFPTKTDLLFEILLTDMRPVFDAGFKLVNAAHDNSREAILDLLDIYFLWFERYDRALLRRFTAESITSPHLDDRSYYFLEMLFVRQIGALMRSLKVEDRLDASIDGDVAAKVVFNIANSEFYAFLADDDARAADVRSRLGQQIDLIWGGLATPAGDAA